MSKKIGSLLLIGAVVSSMTKLFWPLPIQAAAPQSVIINEIAWAGSADNSTDEWLELYNTTSTNIDLTGWSIDDDSGAQTYELTGTIPSHQYYLLESKEIVTSLPGDGTDSLSLSNAGDSLILKDAVGTIIDSVNTTSGPWYAGSNTTHASMARINPLSSGNDANNWQTTSTTSSATASQGSAILGTPKASNTTQTSTPVISPIIVTPSSDKISLAPNETVTIKYTVANAANVSNYGFDISYNPQQLEYINATEGNFLKETIPVTTSFQAGLLNNQPGTLIIGNARTERPLQGSSTTVEKTLFSITFKALTLTTSSTITALASSFLSSPTGTLASTTTPISIRIAESIDLTINNLTASQGPDRYSITLQWQALNEPDISYDVYRRDSHQQYQLLATVQTAAFTDNDSITIGGNIIPTITYHYQVIAKRLNEQGPATTITGRETRGLKADNNRSDRVDGKDLEQIAHFWTIDNTDSTFPHRVDSSHNGIVSGDDLIDLAVDWAKSYSS
ncbi:lamin tail domain-containing protein [Candidatus Gracilibacteria bacterium]|nr:lamin tail domain-containing protein [Candidatus Gracilibacteria bacterium]